MKELDMRTLEMDTLYFISQDERFNQFKGEDLFNIAEFATAAYLDGYEKAMEHYKEDKTGECCDGGNSCYCENVEDVNKVYLEKAVGISYERLNAYANRKGLEIVSVEPDFRKGHVINAIVKIINEDRFEGARSIVRLEEYVKDNSLWTVDVKLKVPLL
ncbi:Uncharacterised protein [Mycobacteroides abscessus subsp. abscessus]|nr:Uncharacterised protein [Mycobacteroides abscessus subsp. abscessus]